MTASNPGLLTRCTQLFNLLEPSFKTIKVKPTNVCVGGDVRDADFKLFFRDRLTFHLTAEVKGQPLNMTQNWGLIFFIDLKMTVVLNLCRSVLYAHDSKTE